MRPISRRTVLGACGTGLAFGAGCLGDTDGTEGNGANGDGSGLLGRTGTWESFRGGPSNAGVADADGFRGEPTERWTAELPTGPGTAAVADGAAYLAAGSTLFAIDLESGDERWTADLAGPRTGSPAVADDAVVCPDGEGLLVVDGDGGNRRHVAYAGETTSARLTSQRQSRPATRSSPAVVDGTAYVGTPDGDLVAIGLADGEVRWRSPATTGWTTMAQQRQSTGGVTSPAVVDGRVIVGTGSGIAAFDAGDGSGGWIYDTESPVRSTPAVVDDTVYVGGATPVALAADSGDVRWGGGDAAASLAADRFERVRRQELSSMAPSVAVGDERLVVHEPDERLVALDRSNGSTRWEAPLEAIESVSLSAAGSATAAQSTSSWSSPAIAGDAVVVGTTRGIAAVSLADGAGLWQVPTESRVVASPAVADGTIVVGDGSGTVHALTSA